MTFLLPILLGGKRLLGIAFAWLRSLSWSQLLCLALAGFALLFYLQRNDARSDAARWEKQYHGERAARLADRDAYTEAQRKAAELNEAEVARIEREQDRITADVESNLNSRLERLRRELRGQTSTDKGAAGGPQASPDGRSGSGTSQEAGVCLTSDQLLRAAENEERHDQLISWIERQLAVPR